MSSLNHPTLANTVLITVSILFVAAANSQMPAPFDKSPKNDVPVVVVDKVPKPWCAPRSVVASKMRDTVSEYARLNGLAFKAFSFEQQSGDFGGVYYWRDMGSTQAWFNPAWFDRVKKERGANAQVRYLEAPLSFDNTLGGTPANVDSSAVATVVDIITPQGVTQERLNAEFVADTPTNRKIPGLLRKHLTVTSNTFGGVYRWKDEASAKARFDAAWHDRVRKD